MKRSHIAALIAALATLAVASFAASTASAAGGMDGTARGTVETTTATVEVSYAVKKFVKRGNRLVAIGEVVGRYRTAEGIEVDRQPFAVAVKRVKSRLGSRQMQARPQQAQRICDVLNLNLAPLRLELLGLIIELDRVVLTIKADSEGGLLGSLLCGLAGRSGATATPAVAAKLTKAMRRSGLATGAGFAVPIQIPVVPPPASPGMAGIGPQDLPPVPPGVCTVLDLVLGPLDLNLLGLLVHLDRVQLRITADPRRGILGSLLCSIAGGPQPVRAPA